MLRNEQMNGHRGCTQEMEQPGMERQNNVSTKKKPWLENCPWPEPTAYAYGFDVEAWREDLSEHVNLLRIAPMDSHEDPVIAMQSAFSYEFNNENLLRQAFTRRSFQIEYNLSGCSEELKFLGDTILSTLVTREILRQFSAIECLNYEAPFESKFNEGELTKIRQQFTSKEALAARARELGLGRFILYGTGEKETDSALEDMMEALIGAVVIDCNWEMETVEKMVNELLCIQLESTDNLLKQSYYDILGSWHQKHFASMPTYEVYKSKIQVRLGVLVGEMRVAQKCDIFICASLPLRSTSVGA